MKIRNWAVFTTDLPDDAVEEDGRFLDYGGLNVVEVVQSILADLGFQTTYLDNLAEKGWQISARSNDLTIWCRITSLYPDIILGVDETMKGFKTSYPELMRHFHEALIADGRFHNITWRSPEEMDSGAAGA